MWIILAFSVAGAGAQLVDGTLGMGFGVTSATLLLLFGVTPVAASAATHAAKLPTTFVSGLAHWRAGNVDKRALVRVGLPGAAFGFIGAVVLTDLSLSSAKAWMSALLLVFGVLIVTRFGLGRGVLPQPRRGGSVRWLGPIGAVGGFVDATGGGGWGPVVTPSLLTVTRFEPRTVVGTVSAAEFLVAMSVSAGFVTGAAHQQIPWNAVLGLVAGGVVMAPIAARLAGRLPQRFMGTLVGGLILLTNGLVVLASIGPVPTTVSWGLALTLVVVIGTIAVSALRQDRAERADATRRQPEPRA